jgi:hypothetical protein
MRARARIGTNRKSASPLSPLSPVAFAGEPLPGPRLPNRGMCGRCGRCRRLWTNGMILMRRRIASPTLRKRGLWLPMMVSLYCGRYSKKSWRMRRAAVGKLRGQLFGRHESNWRLRIPLDQGKPHERTFIVFNSVSLPHEPPIETERRGEFE